MAHSEGNMLPGIADSVHDFSELHWDFLEKKWMGLIPWFKSKWNCGFFLGSAENPLGISLEIGDPICFGASLMAYLDLD